MIDKKNDGGVGFERMGSLKMMRQQAKNVVPFDAQSINEAIERAAVRLEKERGERAHATQDRTFPQEPTPAEMKPTVLKIIEKTEGCDQQLAVEFQAAFMRKYGNDIGPFMHDIANVADNDNFIETNKEIAHALAMGFLQLESALDRIQEPR